jgi:hypothetical protein
MATLGTPLGTVTVLVPAVVDENSVVGPADAVPVVRPTMVTAAAVDRQLLVYLTP